MFSKAWGKSILVLLFITLLAGAAFYPLPVLQVKEDNMNPALLIPLAQGQEFSLEYVHSVQKSPVQEHFVVVPGNHIKLVSTTYQSLGVGLPFLPSEGKLVNNQGTFELTGLNRVFREVRLAVMPVTYQGLIYNDRRYQFSNYFPSGTLIEISVQSYSPGQLIWKKLQFTREVYREQTHSHSRR